MLANHSLPRFAVLAGIITFGLYVNAPSNSLRAQDSPKADNTKVNQQDRTPGAVTADQQKNNLTDRQLTQQIRKAVTADKTLSTYAHNVKIVAQNGAVTLKGPVRSDDEKKTIVAKAGEIAGTDKVTDELSVATPK